MIHLSSFIKYNRGAHTSAFAVPSRVEGAPDAVSEKCLAATGSSSTEIRLDRGAARSPCLRVAASGIDIGCDWRVANRQAQNQIGGSLPDRLIRTQSIPLQADAEVAVEEYFIFSYF